MQNNIWHYNKLGGNGKEILLKIYFGSEFNIHETARRRREKKKFFFLSSTFPFRRNWLPTQSLALLLSLLGTFSYTKKEYVYQEQGKSGKYYEQLVHTLL